MPNPPRPAATRIGLRAVADAAGVSLMTASLAIRNSPRLSTATRQRVQALAEQLGYRPDPEISRLMSRLRPSRKARNSVVIAMIDLRPPPSARPNPYDAAMREGIAARADALGFGSALFSLGDYRGDLRQLLRVVRNRGITGAILLPLPAPAALDPTLDWAGLSVVSATSTVLAPQFHQVVPNHMHNITTVLEDFAARGRRRIAAVFTESLDRRTHRYYSMALAWHGHRERILIQPDDLPEATAADMIKAWLRQHRPDALLGGDALIRLLDSRRLSLPAGLEAVVLTSRPPSSTTGSFDQRPALIGESAVSLLTGMMHNNETGVPPESQMMTIRGVLRPAVTAAGPRTRSLQPPAAKAGRR